MPEHYQPPTAGFVWWITNGGSFGHECFCRHFTTSSSRRLSVEESEFPCDLKTRLVDPSGRTRQKNRFHGLRLISGEIGGRRDSLWTRVGGRWCPAVLWRRVGWGNRAEYRKEDQIIKASGTNVEETVDTSRAVTSPGSTNEPHLWFTASKTGPNNRHCPLSCGWDNNSLAQPGKWGKKHIKTHFLPDNGSSHLTHFSALLCIPRLTFCIFSCLFAGLWTDGVNVSTTKQSFIYWPYYCNVDVLKILKWMSSISGHWRVLWLCWNALLLANPSSNKSTVNWEQPRSTFQISLAGFRPQFKPPPKNSHLKRKWN